MPLRYWPIAWMVRKQAFTLQIQPRFPFAIIIGLTDTKFLRARPLKERAVWGGSSGLSCALLSTHKGEVMAFKITEWNRGLHLITGIRRTIRNYPMPMMDKLLLRKRFIIETVFHTRKSNMGLEHTMHRQPQNASVHIIFCIAAYIFKPTKPNRLNSYP